MKEAELHFHSAISKDVKRGLKPQEIVDLALKTGLSAIVITDHHEVRAADEARNYAARANIPVEVFVGIEVSSQGHMIGIGVQDPISEKKTVEEAADAILKQNGLIVIPHPFCWTSYVGMRAPVITRLIEQGIPIHGFEVFSQGAHDIFTARGGQSSDTNGMAKIFYEENGQSLGAPLGSSDGHGLIVGRARTGYTGDLLQAILDKTTIPVILDAERMKTVFEASLEYLRPERTAGVGMSSPVKRRISEYYRR